MTTQTKKIRLSVCLLVVIFAAQVLLPLASFGASTTMTAQEKAQKAQLEKLYGITIDIEEGFMGYSLLNDIESCYRKGLPQNLFKEMTDYYKTKGIKVVIRLRYELDKYEAGTFQPGKSIFYINIYPNGYSIQYNVLAHETGHFLNRYIDDKYSADKFNKAWISLNGKAYYRGKDEGSTAPKYDISEYFVSDYSRNNLEEDFAEIVMALSNKNIMRSILYESPNGPIAQKVNLLTNVLEKISPAFKGDKIKWGPAIPEKLSEYYKEDFMAAQKIGIIPEGGYKGLFTSEIPRSEVVSLTKNLLRIGSGMGIEDFAKSKGIKDKWYANYSITSSGEFKAKTNLPFIDWDDVEGSYLYSLKIISMPQDKKFRPDATFKGSEFSVLLTRTAAVNGLQINPTDIISDDVLKSDKVSYEQAMSAFYKLYLKMKDSFSVQPATQVS